MQKDPVKNMIFTEKAATMGDGRYVFMVKDRANKNEIKKAIKEIYRVDVVAVNTITIPGKMKRFKARMQKTPSYKKAVVTLKKGQKIELQ